MDDAGLAMFDKLGADATSAALSLRRRFLQGQPPYEPSDISKRLRERLERLNADIAALQPGG